MNLRNLVNRTVGRLFVLGAVSVVFATGCSDKNAPPDPKEVARAHVWISANHLHQIAMSLRLSAGLAGGQFPARLDYAELPDPLLLISFSGGLTLPKDYTGWSLEQQWKWAIQNCCFEYVPAQTEADGANILLFEKPTPQKQLVPVYFMDGQLKMCSSETLTNLLEKQKATGKLSVADRKPLADVPPQRIKR